MESPNSPSKISIDSPTNGYKMKFKQFEATLENRNSNVQQDQPFKIKTKAVDIPDLQLEDETIFNFGSGSSVLQKDILREA